MEADVQHRDRSAPRLLADQKWTGRWVFLLIIKFLWRWSEFFWPMVVISSTQMNVVTMGQMSFTNTYFIEYNLLTTAAVICILPILVIFITLQRWVVQAVVMSGLKG